MAKYSDKEWERMDKEGWNAEAAKLVTAGYKRTNYLRPYWPAIFTKGTEQLVLVRDLGKINWHPRPL